ncbi:hypothetical protein [Kineococcus rubinsiae]|uniref:hypothetical protein n=1 Tax=Kineococcus rubinsiae TaxID=2609562 RepID=UPI00142FB2BA|nr:hypothetical protein [Kineococcus rubinsiae]NIZ91754.1 hypothetical protein [Kineococcus rubinsiae]
MPEGDGIEETVQGQLRVWLTTAAQLAEVALRAREEALRRMQVAAEREAKELASRLAAEQRAAQAELANVHRNEWWERATPQDIAHAYTTARSWASELPEAAQAQDRVRSEMRTRYDVDPETYLAAVAAEAAGAETARRQAEAAQVFPTSEWIETSHEAFDRVRLNKDQALTQLEQMASSTDTQPAAGTKLGDAKGWVGRDYDVDQAIAAKFPQLLDDADRARLEGETERRREATDRAEAERLTADAAQEDRRAEAARSETTTTGVDSTDPRVDAAAVVAAAAVVGAERAGAGSAPLGAEGSAERMRDLIRGQLRGGADRERDATSPADAQAPVTAERDSQSADASPLDNDVPSTTGNPWMQAGGPAATPRPAAPAPGAEEHAAQGAGAARGESAVLYASAERRRGVAAALEAKGIDSETVAAHLAADVAQGRPASDAVKDTDRGAPKARKHRGTGAQQKQRGELSR